MDDWIYKVLPFENIRGFTFSRYCISGLVGDCGCQRCLRERGETPTFRTELAAARRSRIEKVALEDRTRRWLAVRRA